MRMDMRKKWWMFLWAPPAIALFVWIFGEVVMHLWNWLLPPLFGWHLITFWQALGAADSLPHPVRRLWRARSRRSRIAAHVCPALGAHDT